MNGNNKNYEKIFDKVPENVVFCLNKNNIKNKIYPQIEKKGCPTFNCSDDWKANQKEIFNQTYKCFDNCENENCKINFYVSCKKNSSKELCTKCKSGFYPKQFESLIEGETVNCYKVAPKGFYLDKDDYFYKECYVSCETCEIIGDNKTHNCSACKDDFKFGFKVNNYLNCYDVCPYYHFNDDNNNYICTLNLSCPEGYSLIQDKNECMKEKANEIKTSIINIEFILLQYYINLTK